MLAMYVHNNALSEVVIHFHFQVTPLFFNIILLHNLFICMPQFFFLKYDKKTPDWSDCGGIN